MEQLRSSGRFVGVEPTPAEPGEEEESVPRVAMVIRGPYDERTSLVKSAIWRAVGVSLTRSWEAPSMERRELYSAKTWRRMSAVGEPWVVAMMVRCVSFCLVLGWRGGVVDEDKMGGVRIYV